MKVEVIDYYINATSNAGYSALRKQEDTFKILSVHILCPNSKESNVQMIGSKLFLNPRLVKCISAENSDANVYLYITESQNG